MDKPNPASDMRPTTPIQKIIAVIRYPFAVDKRPDERFCTAPEEWPF